MMFSQFPVIDPVATGANIVRLRKDRGLTVRDIQSYFGFEEPQAIYKWQKGQTLPTVDNLFALGALLDVSMDEILVSPTPKLHTVPSEQQEAACCSDHFLQAFQRGKVLIPCFSRRNAISEWRSSSFSRSASATA